jgi:pimeloyl-ACP methyl ester carboxylesterase
MAGSYVLIHGGGTTARFWDRLLDHLDRPALAVDLPGRGARPADLDTVTVDDEVRSVVDDILGAGLPEPIVLVAHSSGGLPVPGIVSVLGDRVAAVVLNAASVPPEGGCGFECAKPRHRDMLLAARENGHRRTPPPSRDPETFRHSYGGDPLDDESLAFVADPARSVVDTMNHYFQPVHWSAAADVAVTYVVNAQDRPVPPALQEEMIGRLPVTPRVVTLDSGHIPAVTAPASLAAILVAVASAPSPLDEGP